MDILDSQKNILEFLNNSKKQNRLAHAYMFEGSKGVGKLQTALYFVCMLWCEHDTPCLKCTTCQSILNKQFLNLIHISSDTSLIKTQDIANLQKEFASTATLDGPRVYIIEDADKMTVDTQNKLLKFIEEPVSDKTYGILLTNRSDLIIPTIKSRVITVTMNELDYNFLVKKLIENNVSEMYCNILPHIDKNVDACLEILNGSPKLEVINLIYSFINKLNIKDITFFYKDNIDILSDRSNAVLFVNLLIELYKDIYYTMIDKEPITFPHINFSRLKSIYKIGYIGEIINQLVELEPKLKYNGNINLNMVKLIIILNGGVIS